MINCAVVVPVYKEYLSSNEQKSFKQLLITLVKQPIILITYRELNTTEYVNIAKLNNSKIEFEYFDKTYFKSLLGYNNLCLQNHFYKRFQKFNYILIYQLDAFVFRDELDIWCNKGYDYIGAPWFEDNQSYEAGARLWTVGNGGFSLRKVPTFIKLFESKRAAYSLKYLYKRMKREDKGLQWLLKAWVLKWDNSFAYLLNNWDDAEDLFYCLKLADTNFRLRMPALEVAMKFAFEQSPSYLFNQNNNQLPFGCHAWEKYEYETFWKKHL